MKPNEIRAQLVLRSITQRSIADKAGVSEQLVSMVINGYRNGEKAQEVKRVIAETLGMDEEEIFGSEAA